MTAAMVRGYERMRPQKCKRQSKRLVGDLDQAVKCALERSAAQQASQVNALPYSADNVGKLSCVQEYQLGGALNGFVGCREMSSKTKDSGTDVATSWAFGLERRIF